MLKEQIGTDAGIIWQLLFKKGKLSLRQVGGLTKFSGGRIVLAVGWLAREGKIIFTEEGDTIYAELIPSELQFYF